MEDGLRIGSRRGSRAPVFVAVVGAPASGKTFLARRLAQEMRACLLDQDTLTLPLVEAVMEALGVTDIDDDHVRTLVRTRRYNALHGVACDNLAAGIDVIAVAPYTAERSDPGAWEQVAETVAGVGGSAHMVWLDTPSEVILANMRARGALRDQDKLRRAEAYIDSLDLTPPRPPHLAVPWPPVELDDFIVNLAQQVTAWGTASG